MNTQADPMGGFSLVEATLTLALSVFLLYALHTTVQSSISARKNAERNHQINEMGSDYLARHLQIPFGAPTDPPASGPRLSELFDDDQELGDITMHQLKVQPDHPGHTFATASDGLIGTWRVRLTNDLDGDRSLGGPREGRSDLLRIEIYFDERLVHEALRADDVKVTLEDVGANYLASL